MNNHSSISRFSQYARLTEKKQLIYLSCKACVTQFEYKHMQEYKTFIQAKIHDYKIHMYNLYVYTFVMQSFLAYVTHMIFYV